MAEEWKIAKSTLQCAGCNAALNSAGQLYFSVLEQQPDGLLRRDFCEECFKQNRPESVYYFWKTMFRDAAANEEKNKRRQPVVDIDFVLDFFKRLETDGADTNSEGTSEVENQAQLPQRLAFRYILALMLTRKKILVQDVRRKNAQGQEVQVFREKRGGVEHEVIEPDLNPEEITAVSTELGVLLGLKAPESVPAPCLPGSTVVPAVSIVAESTSPSAIIEAETSSGSEATTPSV